MTKKENLDRLNSFTELKKDWDGYNASIISLDCISQAKEIINRVKVQPIVMPIATGGVQLEYEVKTPINAYFEIEIDPEFGIGEFFIIDKLESETDAKSIENVINDYENFLALLYKLNPNNNISRVNIPLVGGPGKDGKWDWNRTYCYACGKQVHNQKYCSNCGSKLDWEFRKSVSKKLGFWERLDYYDKH